MFGFRKEKRFRFLTGYIGLTSVLLTSCAGLNQSYTKLKVKQTIDLANKTQEALTGELFVKGDWPAENWWEMYQDDQLTAFIETALKDSPSLSATEAKIREAQQQAEAVRAKLFPTVNAYFNLLWLNPSTNIAPVFPNLQKDLDLYTLLLGFDYELDFWKKNRYQFEAVLGMAKVAEATWRESKLILSATIAKQYFLLMSNMLKMEVLQEILLNRTRHLELVKLRKLNRIDNTLDTNKLSEDVVTLQKSLTALKQELELNKSLLFTLMGQNPDSEIEIQLHWDEMCKRLALPEKIGTHLMARRPDLIAQVWRVTSAARLVGVAFSNFFPSIDLKAFAGFQSLNINDLLKGPSLTESVFPNVVLPLFTGGRLNANYREKVATYESAVYSYNDMLLKASNDVVSGITKVSGVDNRLKYQNQNVQLTKNDYDLVYSRYKHGIDSLVSVLESDEKYLWSKYNQVDLEHLKFQSTIELVQALGGGYVDDKAIQALDKVLPGSDQLKNLNCSP